MLEHGVEEPITQLEENSYDLSIVADIPNQVYLSESNHMRNCIPKTNLFFTNSYMSAVIVE